MEIKPPNGSRLSVTTDGGDPVIVNPYASSAMRYLVGLFLLCWLGGWFMALTKTVPQALSGNAPFGLFFWLGGWTLGGAFAMFILYQSFRPSVPESLRLMRNGVSYDSGRPPFQTHFGYASQKQAWKSFFPKRTRVELDRRNLQTLRLRETQEGNRLTVDADALRLDILQSGGEIEREWLYQLLASRYSIPLAQEGVLAERSPG
jgi:hypothetical protein